MIAYKFLPDKSDSCTTFNRLDSSIDSIMYDPDDNTLYAGAKNGVLWKCNPNEANKCLKHDNFSDGSTIDSLVGFPLAKVEVTFKLENEYNKGTQGIRKDNMPFYEVTVDNGKLIYVKSRKPVTSVKDNSACPTDTCGNGTIAETDYVILVNGKMYVVNQMGGGCPNNQGRFYEILNEPGQPYSCKKTDPWRTSHAGIGISGNYNNKITMKVTNGNIVVPIMTAGEISVDNGKVQWIDSCSGHFKPSKQSLLYSLQSSLLHQLDGFNTAYKLESKKYGVCYMLSIK